MRGWQGNAYAINLKHRDDRLAQLRAELQKHGIAHVTVEVPPDHVLCDALFVEAPAGAVRILRFTKHVKGGLVGCATSHKAIWAYESEQAREDEAAGKVRDPVFIMEDDVVFTPNFTSRLLIEMQHRMTTEADIVTCGIMLYVANPDAFVAPGKPPIIIHTRYVRGAHAYALACRGTVLQRLCMLYSKPGVMGTLGTDIALEILANLPAFTALVTLPYVASQRASPSDNTWVPALPELNKIAESPMLFNAPVTLLPIINHAERASRAAWFKAAGGTVPEDERYHMWRWIVKNPVFIITVCGLLLILVVYAVKQKSK
jgi:hypothetical protein